MSFLNCLQGESALLQYAAHGYARLHELDVDDVAHESSALGMLPEPGGLVYAALVRLPGRDFLDATTRPSVTGVPWSGSGSELPEAEQRFRLLPWGSGAPAVGALVVGRVTSSGRGHDPAGRRVLCRVTRVEEETGRVEVALKASLCRRNKPLLTFDALQVRSKSTLSLSSEPSPPQVGQVVHCDVNKVDERFGLFLTVRGGQGLTGLAHKSQIFESGTKQDFTAVYSKGDYVLAKARDVFSPFFLG